jgi:hypothetical protein
MRTILPIASVMVALSPAVPVYSAEVIRTHAADGACERLIIADEDLTARCGTALAILVYDDDSVAVSAGTGGQDFFGLADPERMLLFVGIGTPWSDFVVGQVVAAPDGRPTGLLDVPASGACTHADAAPGLLITCDARDIEGRSYALTYRTDGGPGLTF